MSLIQDRLSRRRPRVQLDGVLLVLDIVHNPARRRRHPKAAVEPHPRRCLLALCRWVLNAQCWYLLPITYLFHFAVLMLATFGANLAAFLTVERMQTSIQARISKSQPIRQSSWLQQAMNDTYSPSRTLTRWPFSQKSSTPSSQTLLTMNTSRTWLTPRRCFTKLGRISSFPLRQMTPGIYECIYLFTRIG